ncbi:hypothetical protein [Aeromicrobium fastidiosum]|uniref:Uncharacterized protein n=1 Tax=Aeromicrobium fastidiosum TaxID=52699 RepID=A0A641AR79_9ACTN|nr:hypothetical protein [Aeromicrobium fastidiosum]KAA1380439.1 hypothetical protein ESP62_004470 [Aeromicrobium fastidiosum]MBP2390020.1 Spy/CpxP family protein refolding chaperone [Aeromicrobium fastidiosum]
MRLSILSRLTGAVVAAAVGSAVLTSAPATAATPQGVTKETAMRAINGFRNSLTGGSWNDQFEGRTATYEILNRSCDLKPGEEIGDLDAMPAAVRRNVDVMVAAGYIFDEDEDYIRTCVIGVAVATFAGASMTGSTSLLVDVRSDATGETARAAMPGTLSGDVTVTGPLSVGASDTVEQAMLSATGHNVTTTIGTIVTNVPKTAAQKKKAKKAYSAQMSSARKALKKALKKAGKDKRKVKAAKKTFAKKQRKARSVYAVARNNTRVVTTGPVTRKTPFTTATPWL